LSARLKTATTIASGALAAIAIPAANAQGAVPPASVRPHLEPVAHPKEAVPAASSSCGYPVVTWQDNHDNRYLEIYHSGKSNGNWADAYPGNGSCTQHWFAVASGVHSQNGFTLDTYGMVNTNSEKCLAAPTTNVGNAHVVQEICGDGSYDYRWVEFSVGTGWNLIEADSPGYTEHGYISSYGIMACEDTANHWIYTSWTAEPPYGIYNMDNANCIWH
jgi:hypothetical protein